MLMGEFVSHFREKMDRNELLEAICNKNPDLEFLLEELESIRSKDYLANATVTTGSPLARGSETRWRDAAELVSTANSLISHLKREIYLHYRSIDETEKLAAVYLKLLQEFNGDSKEYLIFTTNYDPAIEQVVSEQESFKLIDGFAHNNRLQQYVWTRSEFDDFKSDPAFTSVVLFKLHGSTNWFRNKGRIVKSSPVFAGDDAEYEQVLIYPATRKVAITDPFFTAYDYLEQCLASAEQCLVIGYSFRDYDTLMRFKAASIANQNLKILILDPNAETLVKRLNDEGIRATFLPYMFGVDRADYLRSLTLFRHKGIASGKE